MSLQSEIPRYSERIAKLNDLFRRHRLGNGRLTITKGMEARGPEFLHRVLRLVRSYDAFTPDNDPHGEHNFGAIEIDGKTVYWKLDYYDQDLRNSSKVPAVEAKTCRVLTIMFAHEY